MPTTAGTGRPLTAELGQREREVLHAVGCGLRDDEIAAALASSEEAVSEQLAGILGKLGLRDRAAAIVHAFDCGLVAPGRGPRVRPVRAAARGTVGRTVGPAVRIAVLGPLRAWQGGRPLELGHPRRQAVLAALALRGGRALSRQELLDGVWGLEQPVTNVVPVHIYRLRKILRIGDSPDSVIGHDRGGYRLVSGAAEVDLARMEDLVTAAGAAHWAGDPAEAVRLCSQALVHGIGFAFRGAALEPSRVRIRLGGRAGGGARSGSEILARAGVGLAAGLVGGAGIGLLQGVGSTLRSGDPETALIASPAPAAG
ncbi:winged helix-turn-helix domain-containing protein [Kitasatospora sp. NPDC058184]|uniref:winged helix-turn-helix domain-containing protein n=1 Tax=Kitasatospora sp. NPDC058184 TaxID=3346370 RepID=UPI0036DA61F8